MTRRVTEILELIGIDDLRGAGERADLFGDGPLLKEALGSAEPLAELTQAGVIREDDESRIRVVDAGRFHQGSRDGRARGVGRADLVLYHLFDDAAFQDGR